LKIPVIVVRCLLCAVILLPLVPILAQTPTPNPDTLLEDCTRSLPPDRPMPTGADAPRIKIVAPTTQTVITSDQPTLGDVNFTVETVNWELPGYYTEEAARHWHLWLNDGVWGMFYGNTALSGIPYGTWRICASLGDTQHLDIGMPDAILLTVQRVDDQTVITTQPAAPSSALTTTDPTLLWGIVAAGLFIAVGGYVIGRRVRTR